MLFSQIQQVPGQNFRKVGKSLHWVISTPSAQCGRRESAVHACMQLKRRKSAENRQRELRRNAIERHASSVATPGSL